MERERVGEVKEMPYKLQEETDARNLPVGHDLMVIHRLIEMGLFKM